MSRESYESGFDDRTDDEIKQSVYNRWDDPDIDPMDPMYDDIGY